MDLLALLKPIKFTALNNTNSKRASAACLDATVPSVGRIKIPVFKTKCHYAAVVYKILPSVAAFLLSLIKYTKHK